jgi:hypothetical protein
MPSAAYDPRLNDVGGDEAFTSGLFAIVADVVTLFGVVAILLWLTAPALVTASS